MRDFATSGDPKVQAQLNRLARLSLPEGRIGLDAIRELLARLGNPHQNMPPVFHVAGTNGKGSTCAFLRAMMEAEGLAVHATTSPHLVRYNERIRIAGKLVDDEELAALLQDVLDTGQDLGISFFETTIAAAFLAFSRHPADACVIEVGLGGRFDATNVIETPAVCGIASLGIDHERFLLAPEEGTPSEPLSRIAFEKAGIVKPGCPVVTQSYSSGAEREIERIAGQRGAPLFLRDRNWHATRGDRIEYRDSQGSLRLPLPALPGAHQADNAALAIAMLRHQRAITVNEAAMVRGLMDVRWPARLQLLGKGPLTELAPDHQVWLDGGHNPDGGAAIARHFAGQRLHLVIGMLANKAPDAIIGPLGGHIESLHAVPVPGHDFHEPTAFGPRAVPAVNVEAALGEIPGDGLPILIAGTLYIAGQVLRANGEIPD